MMVDDLTTSLTSSGLTTTSPEGGVIEPFPSCQATSSYQQPETAADFHDGFKGSFHNRLLKLWIDEQSKLEALYPPRADERDSKGFGEPGRMDSSTQRQDKDGDDSLPMTGENRRSRLSEHRKESFSSSLPTAMTDGPDRQIAMSDPVVESAASRSRRRFHLLAQNPVADLRAVADADALSDEEYLTKLLKARNVLQPLLRAASEKIRNIEIAEKAGPVRLGTLLGYSRRLASTTFPPPEYNDPTGADALCVPGFVFPCPDVQTMLRSTLFLGGAPQAQIRCVPPTIAAKLQPGYTTVYNLMLTVEGTADAKSFYSINRGGMLMYNKAKPPSLSAPGSYNIQAYATAPGFLPSHLAVQFLQLEVFVPGVEERVPRVTAAVREAAEKLPEITPPEKGAKPPLAEPVKPAATVPPPPLRPVEVKARSAFGGLFLGEEGASEEESEEEDEEEM